MDKREAVRVPVRVRAECRCSGVVIHGLVEDLSRSGLFLRADSSVCEGLVAEIELDVAGEEPLHLSAEVVRTEPDGVAFKFLHDEESSKPLANFIMRHHASLR